jgi:hypothetical protein
MLLKKSPASKTRPRETSHRFKPLNRTLASKSLRSLGQRLFARRRRKALQNFRTRRRRSNRPLLRLGLRLRRRRRVLRCQCPPRRNSASVGFVIREWHLVAKWNEMKHLARVVFY